MHTMTDMRGVLMSAAVIAGCGRLDIGGLPRDLADAPAVAVVFDASSGVDAPPVLPEGGDDVDGGVATCAALPAICGAAGTGSCCDSPSVPGGMFSRSYDISGDGQFSSPTLRATVSDFRLDKYEVTVGRFRQFVVARQGTQAFPPAAGAGAHPSIAGSGWDPSWDSALAASPEQLVAAVRCDGAFSTWTDAPADHETQPMNCVSWLEAMAFCAWDGGYLPSEAEWNYAATGGGEQRAYPWSVPASSLSIDDTRTSYFVDPTRQCHGDGLDGCTPGDILAVGIRPAGDGKWGHSDLGGNVREWTLDWLANPYPQNPCIDCANIAPAATRVVRGGAYDSGDVFQRTGKRLGLEQTRRQSNIGFRCARPSRL